MKQKLLSDTQGAPENLRTFSGGGASENTNVQVTASGQIPQDENVEDHTEEDVMSDNSSTFKGRNALAV